jgi:hypothetical protein
VSQHCKKARTSDNKKDDLKLEFRAQAVTGP